ncbi:MAG: hypothetical protein A2161_07160 [Candidatus Schekmanbacteria bacterium RBG_13_48_7]|uniref:Uncharacterized protein n=1 Tax=Candidatus Schekmanbacteria bacterium RBG_13_48_7 TaxID=1817878 RepID=A0A1F7RQE1_9BACT|nr:MAG: hypothetical protein A2161_07160 [Candidatus Schekmanbacteria bacterium RBG_13_48_7]
MRSMHGVGLAPSGRRRFIQATAASQRRAGVSQGAPGRERTLAPFSIPLHPSRTHRDSRQSSR